MTGNRLIHATSPYLLQHAHNPVDWYEWGPEALARASAEDKPILLSIGYAACHWCHVMAHESFEDPTTAAIMNANFVCVKVDREERPDLDAIYMDAVQSMTGSGGWPMTTFLTPDGEPFYAGTYFPPEDRHGLPGFPRLLLGLADAWRERRDEVVDQGRRVALALGQVTKLAKSNEPLTEDILRAAHAALTRSFDREWGGFGGAPKFPQPMTLEFLLRAHLRGYPGSLEMVTVTLDRMAAGGIHDQIGGGFHRYSTDGRWLVPHFEKMLYDNAQLARLYLHAWQVTGTERYQAVATQTLHYLLEEMRHPEGGFYSAQDADSEGVEGRFFVWSWDEIVEAARPVEAYFALITPDMDQRQTMEDIAACSPELVARYLGATPEGNWEGTNVLWTPVPIERVAEEAGVTEDGLRGRWATARSHLLEARNERVHPATDDKVLAAWNGLAIAALAESARVLGPVTSGFLQPAVDAAEFVLSRMRREDGRLMRAWRDGRTSGPGYLDDHAMMAAACLELYQTTFEPRWLLEARALADAMIELFHDPDRGFFTTGADAELLVVRPKELFDNAIPAGNSVAADVLQRLAHLTGEPRYERAGVSALRVARDLMLKAPTAFGHALGALDLYLGPVAEVAVVGATNDVDTERLYRVVWARFEPNAVLAVGDPSDAAAAAAAPLLADRPLVQGRPAAYVCERFACRLPVTDPEALAAQLGGTRK